MLDAYIIQKIKEREKKEQEKRDSERPALYIEELFEEPKPKEEERHEIVINL
jgi:hypothetical protein